VKKKGAGSGYVGSAFAKVGAGLIDFICI